MHHTHVQEYLQYHINSALLIKKKQLNLNIFFTFNTTAVKQKNDVQHYDEENQSSLS